MSEVQWQRTCGDQRQTIPKLETGKGETALACLLMVVVAA